MGGNCLLNLEGFVVSVEINTNQALFLSKSLLFIYRKRIKVLLRKGKKQFAVR